MKNFWLERSSFSQSTWHTAHDSAEHSDRGSQKRVVPIVLKSAIAILLSLGAWEIIAENALEKSTGTTIHSALGRINRAGTTLQSSEGFSRTKVNRLGMRGDDAPPKVNGEFRVLSVGDSFTAGDQVDDAKTYSALIESALKRESRSPISVVNAGRAGASPPYYLQLADFYNTTFQPDSVVVQINDSDFTDEALDAKKEFYMTDEGSQFSLHRNQNFASDDRLSQLLQEKFPQLSFLLRVSIVRVGARNLQTLLKGGATPEDAPSSTPKPTEKNYDRLVEWTVVNLKAKYRNLIILHVPYVTFNNPNEPPSPVQTSLTKMAAKYNIPIVAMRKDFMEYYQATHQPASGFNNTIPGTGHINEVGHELIAKRLVPMLEAMHDKASQ